MGIKNLNNLISEFTNIDPKNQNNLANFKNKVFAVDANLYIYKFLYANGNHINGLFFMINKLSKFNIYPIFVFDGEAPKEKKQTLENRKNLKKKIRTQVINLKTNLSIIENIEKRQEINKKIKNLEKRLVYVNNSVIQSSKKLLTLMNILYLDAPREAEQLCANLSRINLVDGVISDDTDTIACGSKIIIRNFNNKTDYISYYNMDEILYELDLNYNSFLDLCILLGTDYNHKMREVGYKSAYKLIKKYANIDNILKNTRYKVNYDYDSIRELFKVNHINKDIIDKISQIGGIKNMTPKINELIQFLENNSTIDKNTFLFRLKKMYKTTDDYADLNYKYSLYDSDYKINLNYKFKC